MVSSQPSGPAAEPLAPSSLASARRVHFVGIGGSGMSGLARLLLQQGKAVSGSDVRATAATAALEAAGARVFVGHRAEHVGAADLVVISAAVAVDNPEVAVARDRGLPVLSHAEALGLLVA